MLFRVYSTVRPTDPLVTLDELRLQARVLFPGEDDPFEGAEDGLLQMLIDSAIDELDAPNGELGRSFMTREYRLLIDSIPETRIMIPHPPIVSIDEIKYIDASGDEQEIALADIHSDIASPDVFGSIWHSNHWPSMDDRPGRMWIDYTAGYDNAANVPAVIRHAVLVKAATKYKDRESTVVGTSIATHEHIARMLDNYKIRTYYRVD